MAELFSLCFEFFKAGLFAIGGGIVTLPFFNEMAEKYSWFTPQEIADMVAISEATPGPFGINMATFAGYKAFGLVGSILATFSMVLPSFIIIILVSKFLDNFSENRNVKNAFNILRPCMCALVLKAWLSIVNGTLIHFETIFTGNTNLLNIIEPVPIIIFILIFCGQRFIKKTTPIFWIIFGAFCGLLFL